jgi:hypothetical protein
VVSFLIARLIAFLLIFEAMFAALYISNEIGQLGTNGPIAMVLVLARGLAGAVQFAGGWQIATRRPPGPVIAQWGLGLGAVITVLGVGFALAPTSIYHWLRWQVTVVYVVYAVGAILFLQSRKHP